jgi:hypothetical protein
MSKATEGVEEQVLRAVTTNQDAVVDAVRRWAETVEKIVPEVPTPPRPEQVPDPAELVDRAFAFATALLDAQREFTHNLLAAAAPAMPGKQAEKPRATRSKKAST